jgi:hypothetical protein
MALRVVAFDTATGDRIARVPGSFTFELPYNGELGSIKVTAKWTREAVRLKTWQRTAAKRTILAVLDGNRVLCAGPITDRDLDTSGFSLNAAASIWRSLDDRFVLNPALANFESGEVLIDEDNPAPQWFTTLTGSLVDIAARLVDLALFWGPLPITTPPSEGGTNVRTYNGWELPTVGSRLSLLTGVADGPELRFVPSLRADGGITFHLEGDIELISKVHRWDTRLPLQRVAFLRITEDATNLASEAWGFGGKSDDVVLAARSRSDALTSLGWPVSQTSVPGLSTVSDLGTLRSHLNERVSRGTVPPEVFEFRVHRSHAPQPGDWADVRFIHPAYGQTDLPLKVLSVSGDSGEWLTVKGRQRNGL